MKDNSLQDILNLLQKKQSATVEQIASETFLSQSSVRRKLTALQEKGLITRTHGGARLLSNESLFPSFSFRSHQNSFEKKNIASHAINFIKDGDFIFLDGSTSAFFVAEYLKDFKNVRVMTNGIDTISTLSKNKIEAYSTGGKISPTNRSVLIGQTAINTIEHYHADVVIFSAQSVDNCGNLFDCFEEENFIRLAMMKNASKKIFLCDSSKLNKSSMFKLCEVSNVDYFICNTDLSGYFTKPFKNTRFICTNKLSK